MSFFEFLTSFNKEPLRSNLESINAPKQITEAMHEEYLDLLKLYFIVGGMPGVVKEYKETDDLNKVRALQRGLIDGYQSDFAKYAQLSEAIKISNIWESIPAQLAKENNKFMFNVIKSGARAREYESALQWLVSAGLVYRLINIENPELPIRAHLVRNNFKIFFLDVGLLGAFCDLNLKLVLDEEELFSTFKGYFVENYVMQELIANGKERLAYWTSSARAEVDFILEYQANIYPLEVKAGTSKKKT
ncbi:ATP-binding protein [Candidatus Margulisiibacteriota bacterium]